MDNDRFINIAPNSTVIFSSTSEWSHDDDKREVLTAEHNREFSFHTDNEENPYVLLDLNNDYIIYSIRIYNRRNYQYRANKLKVEISLDNNEFEIIHSGFVYFSDEIEFNLNNLKKCRYVKISLEDIEYLHLRKIEVFIDKNVYNLACNDINILSSLVNRDYSICVDNNIINQYHNIFKLLRPFNPEGIKKIRVGGENDGGYVMADPGFCGTAFSFGVSSYSPWDLEMAEKGFKVYQFDGTIDAPTEQHENLIFSKLNITGKEIAEDGTINLKGIIDKFNLQNSKDIILQIDIEGYEWEFFDSISDEDLKRFSQIIVEFHGMLNYSKLPFYTKIFEKLNKYHKPIHFHYNNCGNLLLINNCIISSLFEVSFLRKDDIKFEPSSEIYPTKLDAPCVTKLNELYIGQFDEILKNINPLYNNSTLIPLNIPPTHPPEYLYSEYTLNGNIPVIDQYYNNSNNSVYPPHNTKSDYENYFSNLDKKIFNYYGDEGKAFFEVIKKYGFSGKDVTIWGLASINLDAFSIWAGADNVYVVEYNKPIIDHEKIHVFDTSEFESENIQSDIAISYSSFEHDGLGRCGDPLNPNGDIIAMQQAHDHLSDDGILLLGLPLGVDCLVWNAHRIYGKTRLPLMLQNFKLIDVFSIYDTSNPISFENGLNIVKQCVLVLKKINDKYPDDEYLLSKKSDNGKYIDNNLFETINKFIYDYKHTEE